MAKKGTFARQGLSSVRRDWSVLIAVRKFRGRSAPSWDEYVRNTNRGRRDYSAKK